MLDWLLFFVLIQALQAEFQGFPVQQNQFEQPNLDYLSPHGHQLRMESEEDDEIFIKRPLVEHPFYQKQQTPPVYNPPDYQHRLIDEDLFGYIPQSDTAKCYSCMSQFYQAVWGSLQHVYKSPRNFSDLCNDEFIDQKLMPVVHCPTICVAMSEEFSVAGVKIRGYIRGCLDEMLHNGFNQTIVTWKRWMHRDGCSVYKKRELFKLPPEQSDDSPIHVCTCYSDYCNSAIDSAQRAPTTQIFILALAIFGPMLLRN
ncbi:hypothetical protein M3Y97_00083200 [Aphelenchoides bicaudatus]|nr:hypothetical protein M3Y97_00083200 [Aphelenchoides bicaudatus]